ncbi:hypothetical protein, partial [Falsiroseomonas oryzae]|uniref:hypothetical protein n=1 Tax=Falsiroseomonas oryzae TaxID=2766473 RepID=UPI0022EB0857
VRAPQALSARTTVAQGATIRADATRAGPGGRVIVHAQDRTEMRGRISVRGAGAGPGGEVEVSAKRALLVDGTIETGPGGRVLLDPEEVRIVETPGADGEIAASLVSETEGHFTVEAERGIRVLAAVDRSVGPLTLATTNATAAPGDGISVEAPLSVLGDLRLTTAGDIGQTEAGRIAATTLFAESRAGAVRLEASGNAIRALDGGFAAGRFDIATTERLSVDARVEAAAIRLTSREGIALFAPLAAGTVELVALGAEGITQAGSGAGIAAGTLLLESPFAPVALEGAGNAIDALGDTTATGGLALRNGGALDLAGTLNGSDATVRLTLDAGDLTQAGGGRVIAGTLVVAAPGGSVRLGGAGNEVTRLAGSARDALVLDAGRSLLLDGVVQAPEVTLAATGNLEQLTDALVLAGTLRAQATGGAVLLQDPLNEVARLGESGGDTGFALATLGTLTLTGRVAAPEVVLLAGGSLLQGAGGAVATDLLRATALT